MMTFLAELRRRKVFQTGAAYVVGGLAIWGAVEIAAEAFSWPGSVLRYTVFASALGLPVALVAAWFLEVRMERKVTGEGEPASRVMFGALGLGAACGGLAFVALVATLGPSNREGPGLLAVPGFGGRGAIAVMPFTDTSPGGGNVHFADGIAEEILTSLQGWGVFPVISRGSTLGYRDRTIEVPMVAAELGVRYVLMGSVRLVGDDVRVNAQLVDAETDRQMWADRFDGNLGDVFAVQDDFAENIVTAIAPEITRSEMRRTSRARPSDLAAWELVLRAEALILTGTYEAETEARSLLNLALDREPEYALAYARLAQIEHDMGMNLSSEIGNEAAVAAMDEALAHARRGAQLAPSLVQARIFFGHLLLHHRQVSEGLVELREAVRLNPSHAQAHADLGLGLAIDGQVDAAIEELELAIRLSPNDPRNDRIRTMEALAHLYAGNNEDAISSARNVVAAQPDSPVMIIPWLVEISALVREGRSEEARDRAREFRTYHVLDWPGIERGAWSQDELDRVHADLVSVGMLQG